MRSTNDTFDIKHKIISSNPISLIKEYTTHNLLLDIEDLTREPYKQEQELNQIIENIKLTLIYIQMVNKCKTILDLFIQFKVMGHSLKKIKDDQFTNMFAFDIFCPVNNNKPLEMGYMFYVLEKYGMLTNNQITAIINLFDEK